MIIDFNNHNFEGKVKYDLCIVGSGAASLAMLSKLIDTNLNVLVLEAGGELITEKDQDIYRTINDEHPFPGAQDGRFRAFGGSTTKWGGQSLPLENWDFSKRPWVDNSGWPISATDVSKYISQVDSFLNLYPNDYDTDIYSLLNKQPLTKNPFLKLKFSKWSPLPNLREKYRKQLLKTKNVVVLQHTNLLSINLSDDQAEVASLTVTNFEKKIVMVYAHNYILACGGIENARLLLASNKQKSAGVGNDHDLVGRFLQDHPNAHIATLYPKDRNAQQLFNYFYIKKTRFLPRFVFSEQFQKSNELLNCSAYFSFITHDDNAFAIMKDLYRNYRRGDLSSKDFKLGFKLFKSLPALVKIGGEYLFSNRVYTPDAVLKLNLMTESAPEFKNRVTLSNELDTLGMPKAKISWHANEKVLQTFKKCTALMKEYFDQLDLGQYDEHEWMHEDNWFTYIKDAKHHIGTTRMSKSPETGVVDADCKVFGQKNLFIAGSSVFPTSGHSNPTSTIIALAFRLIDHIKHKLND